MIFEIVVTRQYPDCPEEILSRIDNPVYHVLADKHGDAAIDVFNQISRLSALYKPSQMAGRTEITAEYAQRNIDALNLHVRPFHSSGNDSTIFSGRGIQELVRLKNHPANQKGEKL
tara:strand:- start:313 stop:660 length:348 start_codon:yes stop_codon:yes gene_type:complete